MIGPNGTPVRTPFAGNMIPANLIDPNMVNYAKTIFPAAGPSVLGQYNTVATANNPKNQDQWNLRADEYVTAKDTMWFRYSSSDQSRVSNAGFEGLNDNGATNARNMGVNYVHTFNATTLASITFGHDRLDNTDDTLLNGANASALNQKFGFAPAFGCGYKQWGGVTDCLVPGMDISGFIGGGEGTGGGSPLNNVWQITGDFAKTWHNHTFKAGYDYQWQHFSSTGLGGSATFAPAETADPANPGTTGSALASFLLGVPDSADKRETLATVSGQYVTGAYFQDQWKASRNLTVNLGVRYEIGGWPKYGQASNGTNAIGELNMANGTYILQDPEPSCASTGVAPCIPAGAQHILVSPNGRLWDTPKNNWGPRVGLAYRLGDRTSVRAGFGIFYDQLAGITQTVQGIGGDWPAQTQILANNLNAATAGPPSVFAENPFVGQLSALPPASPFTQVEWYRDPNQKNAYSEQWNFQIQRAVGSSMVVEAGYVGSHSSRLTVGTYANTAETPGPGLPIDRAPYSYITPTFYYHGGTEDAAWWPYQHFPAGFSATGTGDRSTFLRNWETVVTEIGNRYGANLDAFLFDDGMIYYPAPFEKLERVARAGNPKRLVSWNAWIMPRFTDFQDIYFGEGSHGEPMRGSAPPGGTGIFNSGPQEGLLQQGMFVMDGDWGVHTQGGGVIKTDPSVTSAAAIGWARSAASRNVPISFDLMMYEDGTVAPSDLAILNDVRQSVYGTVETTPTGVHSTAAHGDSLSFTFDGTGVDVLGPPSHGDQRFSVTLDGSVIGDFSAFAEKDTQRVVVYSARHLSAGKHTVALTKPGSLDVKPYAFRVVPNPTVLNDKPYTLTDGEPLTVQFVGTGIELIGSMEPHGATANVSVDGAHLSTIQTGYPGPYAPRQHYWGVYDLKPGPHTLHLSKTSGASLQIDQLKITP